MLRKIEFLLLFRCLFRLFILNGMNNATACMETFGKFSEASKRSDLTSTINLKEFARIKDEGTTGSRRPEKNKFHEGMLGASSSSKKVKQLSTKRALYRAVLERKLKQEILKRQVSVKTCSKSNLSRSMEGWHYSACAWHWAFLLITIPTSSRRCHIILICAQSYLMEVNVCKNMATNDPARVLTWTEIATMKPSLSLNN